MARNRVDATLQGWIAMTLALSALTGCKSTTPADEGALGSRLTTSTRQSSSVSADATRSAEQTRQVKAADALTPPAKDPADKNAPPIGLAKKSAQLEPVTRPPDATVARIETAKAQAGSRYRITFSPYGKGPGSGLVIHVSESNPAPGVDAPFDFTGRNALVDTSRLPVTQTIDEGGTYEGTLELIASEGVLVPFLVNLESGSRGQ